MIAAYPTMIEGASVENAIVPTSLDEALRFMGELTAERKAVFPVGGGTSLDFGLPPSKPGVAFSTTALTEIDDYPSEDMTITVASGIRMGTLQKALAEKGQMLAVDVVEEDAATLGGILATNASGPRRFGYGTLRDYVLGIDMIDAHGHRVHGGGRVVKNVAGYDFMKLNIGALGTLGVIVQATLKLRPIPEARGAVVATVAAPQLEPALNRLNLSQTRPVAVEVVDTEVGADAWRLYLLFEENAEAVRWQIDQSRKELAPFTSGPVEEIPREEYSPLLKRLTEWPGAATNFSFKANLLPGNLAGFLQSAIRLAPGARFMAHAGSGIVRGTLPDAELGPVRHTVETLSSLARSAGGDLTLPRCPTAWKSELPVWGTPRGEWTIMRKLKQKLDPKDLLNPGRFIR